MRCNKYQNPLRCSLHAVEHGDNIQMTPTNGCLCLCTPTHTMNCIRFHPKSTQRCCYRCYWCHSVFSFNVFFSLIFSAIEKSWKNLKSFIAISFFFMYTDVKHIFSKFLPFQQRIKENRIKKTVIVTGDREWKARGKNANEWNGVQTSKMRFGGGSRHRK